MATRRPIAAIQDHSLEVTDADNLRAGGFDAAYASAPLLLNGSRLASNFAAPGTAGANTWYGLNAGNTSLVGATVGAQASYNSAFGVNAQANLTTAPYCSAFGVNAQANLTTAEQCSAFGFNAQYNLTTAPYCSAFGVNAQANLTTGLGNSHFGYQADVANGSLTNTTGLGYQAVTTKDNQVVIGNAAVVETVLRGTVLGGVGANVAQSVLVGKVYVNTTPITNTGNQTLMEYVLPANALIVNGAGVRVTAWGHTSNQSNFFQIQMYFGNNTLIGEFPQPGFDVPWRFTVELFRTALNTQTGSAVSIVDGVARTILTYKTEDETAPISIRVACSGVAGVVTQNGMLVEFFN